MLPFGVILLSPKNYPVARFESAFDLGQLRSAKSHLHVANVNAIIGIQAIDDLLVPFENERLNRNGCYVISVR